jgi:hypothetical protein
MITELHVLHLHHTPCLQVNTSTDLTYKQTRTSTPHTAASLPIPAPVIVVSHPPNIHHSPPDLPLLFCIGTCAQSINLQPTCCALADCARLLLRLESVFSSASPSLNHKHPTLSPKPYTNCGL